MVGGGVLLFRLQVLCTHGASNHIFSSRGCSDIYSRPPRFVFWGFFKPVVRIKRHKQQPFFSRYRSCQKVRVYHRSEQLGFPSPSQVVQTRIGRKYSCVKGIQCEVNPSSLNRNTNSVRHAGEKEDQGSEKKGSCSSSVLLHTNCRKTSLN